MKIVSFYEMAPDALSKVMTHFPAHRARLDEFHARGVLLAAGPLGNPPEGAMAVFTTREAAEQFIQGDPFVTYGLVSKWRLVVCITCATVPNQAMKLAGGRRTPTFSMTSTLSSAAEHVPARSSSSCSR